jgi:phage anti-repressor protein
MVKQFTRKQLQEQLGFDAEETKIILEYQKKLPILLQDNNVWIDVKDLWKQLGVKSEYSNWIKQQIKDLLLLESKDYFTTRLQSQIGNTKGFKDVLQYNVKVTTAKEIAMISGTKGGRTSKELIENSKLARKYFICIEDAVRKNFEWLEIRNPEKEGYKKLCSALNDYMINLTGHEAIDWDYRFEANALNVICTGFEAQEIRNYLGCIDKITRDSLTKQYNEYLYKLQEMDIVYLGMGLNRYQRYEILNKTFNILYPDATSLIENANISKILENKKKLLEEAKSKTTDSTLPFGLSA